jgi:hypothetical protein
MTNTQLYLLLGAPMIFNAALIGLFALHLNAKFDAVNERFQGIHGRFDDMNDRWRADTRLKPIEER